MYRQFALVIAATAILSGINAITLKPTQSAQFLRAQDPNRPRGGFARGFARMLARAESSYLRLISAMCAHCRASAAIAGLLIAAAVFGFTRIPTGFIPTEDQGYLIISVQLPDAASLERTENALEQIVASTLHNSRRGARHQHRWNLPARWECDFVERRVGLRHSE